MSRLLGVVALLSWICLVVAAEDANDDYCDVQTVGSSACAWRDGCDKDGCSRCVLNKDRINNLRVLEDRAFGEGYWELCPQLAMLVDLTVPGPRRSITATSQGVGRQLLEVAELSAPGSAQDLSEDRLNRHQILNSRRLAHHLMQTVDATPSTSVPGDVELPIAPEYALDCPLNVTIDGGESLLVRFGESIQSVFQAFAAGDELTEQQRKFIFVLDTPNRWLTLMKYLLDPPSIKKYTAQHCSSHVVGVGKVNERITAARWVRQNVATLPKTQPMRVCTDKQAVAWKEFHQGLLRIGIRCSPPFEQNACYPKNTWLYVMDSAPCSSEYSIMFDAHYRTLQDLADLNSNLHKDCAAITDKDMCQEASDTATVFAARADLVHAKLPFKTAESSELAVAVAARIVKDAEAALSSAEAGVVNKGVEVLGGNDEERDATGNDTGDTSGDTPEGSAKAKTRISTALIIGPSVAVACLLCAACAAAVCWRKRRLRADSGDSEQCSKNPHASSVPLACSTGSESSEGGKETHFEQGATRKAPLSSKRTSPHLVPEIHADTNATAIHAPHLSHTPTEVELVLDATGLHPDTLISGISQVTHNSDCTPECSMFARSALEAKSSMAGDPSAPPSILGEDENMFLTCMPEMHGAIESDMASIQDDPSDRADALSEAAMIGAPPSAAQLIRNRSLVGMHGASVRSCLWGIQGGPSALSGMHQGASSGDETSALGSVHGVPSGTGTSMGGDDDTIMIPFTGAAPRALGEVWVGHSAEHVCQALDMMCQMQEPFANRYELRGVSERKVGDTAIVQVATDRTTGGVVAIKIYTTWGGFEKEQLMYSQIVSAAVGTRPEFSDNADCCAMCSRTSFVFPPYSVSQQAESLEGRLQEHPSPSLCTAMEVVSQLALAIQALNGAGYAHCNIKPSNILQGDRDHIWVLSDLASCAPLGVAVQLSESTTPVRYRAPETIIKASDDAHGAPLFAVASTEADIWALGAIAFELLTHVPLLPSEMPLEQAYTVLSGDAPAPWELDRIAPDDASGSDLWRAAEKLPAARSFVLACLHRDPEKRPPVASLVEAWRDVMADAQVQ